VTAAITFGGGALLGIASSLHCIGMCGGIAMLLGLPPGQEKGARLLAVHLPLHAGRALSYTALGGIAGAIGAAAIGAVAVEGAHLLMRWAAAMTLVWVGLSTMGLMPSPAIVGHAMLPRISLPRRSTPMPVFAGRFAAGVGWGLMPCGMVYGALLFAAFAGSALGGMAVMAGFALGTMPALFLVHGGSSVLSRLARRPELRWLVGSAIVALALLSLLANEATLLKLCRSLGLPV
jgi:sulfite exporter TauE/SafE